MYQVPPSSLRTHVVRLSDRLLTVTDTLPYLGAPSTYSSRPLPFHLSSVTTPTRFAYPGDGLETMFRAVEMMNPKYPFDNIDVLADAKMIKSLPPMPNTGSRGSTFTRGVSAYL